MIRDGILILLRIQGDRGIKAGETAISFANCLQVAGRIKVSQQQRSIISLGRRIYGQVIPAFEVKR